MIDTGTGLVICAIVYGVDRLYSDIRWYLRERRKSAEAFFERP